MRLSFHVRVQAEVNEAVTWYEGQKEGLGDDFYDKLSATLEQISLTPESCPFWLKSRKIRRAKLKRFPFDVLFEAKADRVKIVCVRHEKRHPSYGLGRK